MNEELAALREMNGGGFLCRHALAGDLAWLARDSVCIGDVAMVDTLELERALIGTHECIGVERLAHDIYGIHKHGVAHNGGNDAVVTASLLARQVQRRSGYQIG